jgi:chloramphenicol-sensitive protein RarD
VDAALLGLHLWLFGWAPQSGHGLDLSLGYLILPLVMVVVSVVVYREKLSRWRIGAVLCAAAGVTAAVVVAGGLRWPTLLVALGLPFYFISRRAFALDSAAAQLFELSAMLPFSVFVLAAKPSLGTVTHRPHLIAGLVLLGLLSAAGFVLYLTAGRVLPFSLFGVLSYVEPVLLVLVSLTFLGEPWQSADTFAYIPICAGLVLLALESAVKEPAEPKQPAPQVDSARP